MEVEQWQQHKQEGRSTTEQPKSGERQAGATADSRADPEDQVGSAFEPLGEVGGQCGAVGDAGAAEQLHPDDDHDGNRDTHQSHNDTKTNREEDLGEIRGQQY